MDVFRVAILNFCNRKKGKSFCPSEVVGQMFPQDWQLFLPDIREEMMAMYREDLIQVTQKGVPVDRKVNPKGPVRIMGVTKPK